MRPLSPVWVEVFSALAAVGVYIGIFALLNRRGKPLQVELVDLRDNGRVALRPSPAPPFVQPGLGAA